MNQIKSEVPSRKELEKLQQFVEESQDTHRGKEGQNYQLQLTSIEKQRREWEEAREKAEAMSQIFDSLIITSKIKYISSRSPDGLAPAYHTDKVASLANRKLVKLSYSHCQNIHTYHGTEWFTEISRPQLGQTLQSSSLM